MSKDGNLDEKPGQEPVRKPVRKLVCSTYYYMTVANLVMTNLLNEKLVVQTSEYVYETYHLNLFNRFNTSLVHPTRQIIGSCYF